jgi:hypothetical protein
MIPSVTLILKEIICFLMWKNVCNIMLIEYLSHRVNQDDNNDTVRSV